MAECGVDHGSNSVLRDLILVVEPEPERDLDALDRSVRQLRAELRGLDVESVALGTSEDVPLGAKGVDPFGLSALLITLTATGGVVTVLLEIVRDWLARHAAARRISVTIEGDTIVLERGSERERNELIKAYLRRHEVN